jgi:hypothetical protein
MFEYEFAGLNTFLKTVLQNNLTSESWSWLQNEGLSVSTKGDISKFNIAFVAMPRKTGKSRVKLSMEEESELKRLRKDLSIKDWSNDRLSRVWLIMQVHPKDKEKYISSIENLFLNAEMGELVALYSSLPVLAFPSSWKKRCAEGIRSNIGQVLEAIICNNPYPSEQLDEAAWNQLVLKAIFTEKPVLEITGLKNRMNKTLTQSLSDYAHERWAAHRTVNPLLWMCVSPFINAANFSDIQRVFDSEDSLEREAAALACYESSYEPARKLVEQNPGLEGNIVKGRISWSSIAERMKVNAELER